MKHIFMAPPPLTRLLTALSAMLVAFVVVGCATPNTQRQVLDREDVRNEVRRQKAIRSTVPARRRSGIGLGKNFSQKDLTRLAEPILRANTEFCGKRIRRTSTGTMCNLHAYYSPDKAEVNAYTDGRNIYIARGMARFVESEAELQAVIAHELAHITSGHVNKKKKNTLIGGIFGFLVDLLMVGVCVVEYMPSCDRVAQPDTSMTLALGKVGRRAYSKRFEQEADYISVYMLARAGVDTSVVPHLWRRMGASGQSKITGWMGKTHPPSSKRYVALEQAHQEVTAKIAAGCPLVPEPKRSWFSRKKPVVDSCRQ